MQKAVILKKTDSKFIAKHTCGLESCDEHFVFRATQAQLDIMNKIDVGLGNFLVAKCKKYHKQSVMNTKSYARWQRIFTGGKIEVIETTYDKLFEEE